MTRLAISLLLATASLLGAILAGDLGAFSPTEPQSTPQPRVADVAPPLALPDPTTDRVATILARPLFSPDRRPVAVAAAAASGNPMPQGLPRLAGVIVGPFGPSAIFAVEGGKPTVVKESGRIDIWDVRVVNVGTVRINGPGGARTLHPSFELAPDAPAAPPRFRSGLPSAR
jgi:hypothetical protein